MKIVIDIQGLQTQSKYRGIGRYIKNHIKALIEVSSAHEFTLLINSGFKDDPISIEREFTQSGATNVRVLAWTPVGYTSLHDPENFWRHNASQIIRESLIASINPDLVYVTSLFEGFGDEAVHSIGLLGKYIPTATLLYDLIPLFRSESYLSGNWLHKKYYHEKLSDLSRSDLILTISESVADDANKVLGIEKSRLVNIYAACDQQFRKLEDNEFDPIATRSKFGISSKFFLYTGGYDERKNLGLLIEAYCKLPPELIHTFQLVFVGHMSEEYEKFLNNIAQANGIEPDRILFLDYLDDSELVHLYNLCSLFIFPSIQEGFGLPPLEAMACGAPTIAANIPVLAEILNQPRALFDPFSADDLTEKIKEVVLDPTFSSFLAHSGRKRASEFDWNQFATISIDAFQKLLEGYKHTNSSICADQALARAKALFMKFELAGSECPHYLAGKAFIDQAIARRELNA